MRCTVFIDESGDTGLKKVRQGTGNGASPYFVLAACVMPEATQILAKKMLKELEDTFGRHWKHATDLNHSQTVYFSRKSVELNLRFFAVVSKKATLEAYAEEISWKPHKFYNKCTQYLLERVGGYLRGKGLFDSDPDVVFEGRNHDFDALRRYVGKIKDDPQHAEAKNIQCFNPFGFVERAKHEEPLLKYADLAAHAVYQCVNKTPNNYNIPEPRYIAELQSRFGADVSGKVLGAGLKCIHSIESIKFDADVRSKIESLRAMPRVAMKHR
ncbi:DUF3800 domain-containing protein [Sedimentitalea sp. XS_ASV28]|uniref:DUF3800 domain-containing protein n=1 Tax=Sedimentitalea sp. XS_ASV28 TaxID=3241296 RepID=UPI003514567F